MQTRRVIALIAAVLALGCSRPGAEHGSAGEVSRSWNPAEISEVKDVPVATIRAEIKSLLEKRPVHLTDEQWTHTRHLYRGFSGGPLWMDDDGLIKDRASALVDALVNATSDALNLDQYPLIPLAYALDTVRRLDRPTPAQIARADLLLSASYVSLGEDYLRGQIDPKKISQSWHIDREDAPIDSALARSLKDGDLSAAIARMRPDDYEYEMLRRKLQDYRTLANAGGWPAIQAGPAMKIGEGGSLARLHALRARLRAEGFDVDTGNTYDRSFATAVAQFQQRHGIKVDSMIGQETLDALNVPTTVRTAQIAANLERRRWLPRTLGTRYIFVNVPAFRLEGYEAGRKTIEMKVIVGAEYEGRATPVFSDSMQYVIFRPYWDVPPGIAEKELIPNGVPSDFVWSTYGGEPHLRQRPGPKNALGLVKLIFPNDFNIYLHDTPNDNLFDKDVRAFSHGCIRVEKPAELAAWALGWPLDRVRKAMENGPDDRRVNLPRKIPVYIGYFTTYVRDGTIWFGNDLYERDDDLTTAIAGGAFPSQKAVLAIKVLRDLTD
jgi:L,D-transpeptidase YcbB